MPAVRDFSRLSQCGFVDPTHSHKARMDGARRIQTPSATELILADQYCTKSNAPAGRNSSAGACPLRRLAQFIVERGQRQCRAQGEF